MYSVCAFLAALPVATRLTFLHTQHLGGQADTVLVEKLAAHCALPVRLASQGKHVGQGDVLVVPAGKQVRDRKSVVYGTSVSVRVDIGGRRIISKYKQCRSRTDV